MKNVTEAKYDFEDKGNVAVHGLELSGSFAGTKVVRLDVAVGNEQRFRLHTPRGNQGRISESEGRHFQEQKLHIGSGLYHVHQGWLACITEGADGTLNVNCAFAGVIDRFYLLAPANEWYILYLSGPNAWAYGTSDNNTGKIEKEGPLLQKVKSLSEADILRLYGEQQHVPAKVVAEWVEQSRGKK